MKKGDKRKRQKALKKRSGRREVGRQARAAGATSVLGHVRRARSYPIEGCWAGEGWEEGGMAVVVVARRQPNGNVLFGTYLVDCYCLGLKDTYFNADLAIGPFRREMLPEMYPETSPVEISPALAHEIVYGGIEYAAALGFRSHRDFRRSQQILDPPDAHPRSGTVTFGHEGKPLFIRGPYDNVEAILRQLDRAVGAGNYDHLYGLEDAVSDEWDEQTVRLR